MFTESHTVGRTTHKTKFSRVCGLFVWLIGWLVWLVGWLVGLII